MTRGPLPWALWGSLLLCACALAGCGGGDGEVELEKPDAGGAGSPSHHGDQPEGGGADAGGDGPHAMPPQAATDAGGDEPIPLGGGDKDGGGTTPSATCGDVDCGLHGDCVEDDKGVPGCVCDKGYVARAGATKDICREDKSCVTARMLRCRWNSGSAVYAHFSLSYCSGNPYTGLDVADLLVDEKGNEDFEPLLPSESSATIIPHEFTAHVYVVLDISNSITTSDVLDDVADGIRSLLDALEAQGGRYRFAVYLFDGKPELYEFIPDTDDLGAARTALDTLAMQTGDDPSSSNVYGAVIEGIHAIDRAQTLRAQVSLYGVLTTGTLIVVSDGDDRASLRSFGDAQAAINGTVSNVITVGLGDVANFPKLTEIGRDGSFSAPEPARVDAAFDQIAKRIELVGKSLYFIGYCSPTRKGDFITRIGVEGFDFDRPTCPFNADGFSPGCDASTFDRSVACLDRECGAPACGECAQGSCCYNGKCVAPVPLPVESKCGLEWMCADPTACEGGKCTATVGVGSPCGADLCDPGITYCGLPYPPGPEPGTTACQPSRAESVPCEKGAECASLACGIDPDFPGSSTKFCRPPAKMYAACSADVACEPGSYCDNGACKPQITGGACGSSQECMTGDCVTLASGAKVCGGAPSCLFSYEL